MGFKHGISAEPMLEQMLSTQKQIHDVPLFGALKAAT